MNVRRHYRLTTLAALVVLAIPSSALAASPGQTTRDESGTGRATSPTSAADPDALTTEQALELDAQSYAHTTGVSQAEALEVLRAQGEIAVALDRIRQSAGPRFDGAWFDDDGKHATVRLVGQDFSTTVDRLIAQSGSLISVEHTDSPIVPSRRAIADEAARVLHRNGDSAGVGVDPRDGSILFVVDGPPPVQLTAAASSGPALVAEQTARVADVPTRVEWTGGTSSDDQRGGVARTGCTIGFSIAWTAGGTGVVSAGHCDPNTGQKYATTPTGSPSYTLTHVNESRTSTTDMETSRLASHTPLASFFGQSSSTATAVTGTGTAWTGQYLCHRGKVTGYTCGYVVLIDYAPPTGACPSACASTWVLVQGIDLRRAVGDSGGPWFIGTTAYGVHKGGSGLTTAWYCPIGRLANLGARVLT